MKMRWIFQIHLQCGTSRHLRLDHGRQSLSPITFNFVCLFVADFVLTYEEDMELVERKSLSDGRKKPKKIDKKSMTQQQKVEAWRQKFLNNLRKAGLEMEEVTSRLPARLSVCVLWYILNHLSGGSRITQRGFRKPIILVVFLQKLHKNKK